ncbi:Serine/threonine-protein phosphatase 7 long form homolog [Linum perenne]
MSFPAYHIVTPLICYFSVQWHMPDRVLRQFGMDHPLPTFDMPRSEVMLNLELTQWGTQHKDWVARYPRYVQFWEERFDHLAVGPWMVDPEDWSFHGEYSKWYHAHTRRGVSHRGVVMETLVRGVEGCILIMY